MTILHLLLWLQFIIVSIAIYFTIQYDFSEERIKEKGKYIPFMWPLFTEMCFFLAEITIHFDIIFSILKYQI